MSATKTLVIPLANLTVPAGSPVPAKIHTEVSYEDEVFFSGNTMLTPAIVEAGSCSIVATVANPGNYTVTHVAYAADDTTTVGEPRVETNVAFLADIVVTVPAPL